MDKLAEVKRDMKKAVKKQIKQSAIIFGKHHGISKKQAERYLISYLGNYMIKFFI
jgi:hypothetical protein